MSTLLPASADPNDHAATLEALLRARPAGNPYEFFRGVTHDFWYWAFTEGYQTRVELRELLPELPSEELQLQVTGYRGVDCLNEGFFIYHAFKSLYEQYAGEIAQCEQVLDFGCGWGRISRFFLKDLEPSRLLGVDPIAEYLAVCQQTNRWQRFQQIPCHPPTDLPVETFDWIYSFSVFSHLSETMHEQVLRELHRLLKPGGLLTVTTHQREMITFCQELRDDERVRQAWPDSVNASMASFLDQERTLADYDNGRYCYSSLNLPDEWSYWGDAAIPEGYVREHWTRLFHFVEFVSDPNRAPQNVIVMRK